MLQRRIRQAEERLARQREQCQAARHEEPSLAEAQRYVNILTVCGWKPTSDADAEHLARLHDLLDQARACQQDTVSAGQ